ncbi:MAG: hypothetical protein ACK4ZD_01115 [Caldimonas sp.]|jgi:hypothetical protein|uniref:hypothetical protein n=1 Tax=Caldimonas sp. TaxID=2838790 RepID=UPI00391D3DA5
MVPAPLLAPAVKRRLLAAVLASVTLPWLIGAWIKAGLQEGLHDDAVRAAQLVDYIVTGGVIFLLAMVVTVSVGCLVVAVMQGPRRQGDPFPDDRNDGS